ncbi:TlpA disulfide reductase family protein [Mangrovimonas xylaniphaga]|uniref:TlpA disulfide reductase family protein n=1 Tax=Mangrovimonas xylaniphaga TaxID=1645915 RepID=UPI000B273D6F|nr:TlpA disulfide reductase family protein [Mangrovimonas xylaniphaga]
MTFKHTPLAQKTGKTIVQIVLGIIVLLSYSCKETPEKEFFLQGTTNGIENGTTIYLENEEFKDSTIVSNNTFNFKTKLPYAPIQAILRTKDYSTYRFLWLEDSPMSVDASNGDFKTANVIGSESESLNQSLHRILDTLPRAERRQIEMDFIKNNPNSIISANALAVYSTTYGKEKTMELFEPFSEQNKASRYGQKIARYIALNKDPKIGEQLADFEMNNQYGEPLKLSKTNGKVILLEFWASWCGPCREENPNLVKTYKEFNPKGFEVFAVSLDEHKEKWIKAIEKDSLNWLHVSDLKGDGNEASLIYGINGIPDNFLIAENGEIIARDLYGEELTQKLEELLN